MFQFKLGDGETLSQPYNLINLKVKENLTLEEGPPTYASELSTITIELNFTDQELQGTFELVEYTLPEASDP